MQFFTRAWLRGELSPEEREAVVERYLAHLLFLEPHLSESVRQLARHKIEPDGRVIDLYGARLHRVQAEREARRLELEFHGGSCDCALSYFGVDWKALDLPRLERLASGRQAVVLCDEVDMPHASVFEHRVLLSPDHELSIRFRDFAWKHLPPAAPDFPLSGEPGPEPSTPI